MKINITVTKSILFITSLAIGIATVVPKENYALAKPPEAPLWRLPWSGGKTATINQTWHGDHYGKISLDFRVSGDVLAPIDSEVIRQCNAGNNHRAIELRAADGQIYSLIHVTTSDIFVGKKYKQGEKIGTVATDKPTDTRCARSTGTHLHFGLPTTNFEIDGYNLSSVWVGKAFESNNSYYYLVQLKATPPSGVKQCLNVDGTKIGIIPGATQAGAGNCAAIQEQQFHLIYDGNGYYRLELKALPPSGVKQCLNVDGTKIGIIPGANLAGAGNCAAIQEQQFRLIDDGNSYYRLELKALPPSRVKQCINIDGTKIGIIPGANLAGVGNCAPIQEQQFKLMRS